VPDSFIVSAALPGLSASSSALPAAYDRISGKICCVPVTLLDLPVRIIKAEQYMKINVEKFSAVRLSKS